MKDLLKQMANPPVDCGEIKSLNAALQRIRKEP